MVCINSFTHLLYVTTLLPPMNGKNALTHIVAKMFAGIGILDFFDNTAAAVSPFLLPLNPKPKRDLLLILLF